MITQAPFETFEEHGIREGSEAPYNEVFIQRCKEAAERYQLEDRFLRPALLAELKKAVPLHYRKYVGV